MVQSCNMILASSMLREILRHAVPKNETNRKGDKNIIVFLTSKAENRLNCLMGFSSYAKGHVVFTQWLRYLVMIF